MLLTALPLQETSEAQRSELAAELDVDGIRQYVIGRDFVVGRPPAESIAWRTERDLAGETMHLMVFVDEIPIGWAGWTPYVGNEVETTTYLVPAAWGTGINPQLKALQWQVCVMAGRRLVITTSADNERSQAAVRKLWPGCPEEQIWAPAVNRYNTAFHVEGPPLGYQPWPDDIVEHCATAVRAIPAAEHV